MNLFVLGWSPSGALDVASGQRALTRVVEKLPFFHGSSVETWRSRNGTAGVAWVSHSSLRTAGVSYIELRPDAMALFSGRPIAWTDEFEADGQAPLSPSYYLGPAERWASRLDGRCAAASYDEASGRLEVYADPLGSYPLYRTEAGGEVWISNNAGALRELTGSPGMRQDVVASFIGCGWALGGEPLWEGVWRLPRGALHRFHADQPERQLPLMPVEAVISQFGAGFDPVAASRIAVAATRALADWPGRPNLVSLTGGRDSRLTFAAALQAGFECEVQTGAIPGLPGYPQTSDVQIASLLAEKANLPHRLRLPQVEVDSRRAVPVLQLASSGVVSVGDLGPGPPAVPDPGAPLPLLHTGAGGEISRTFYGLGDDCTPEELTQLLRRALVPRWPRSLLSRDGQRSIGSYLQGWVDQHLEAGVTSRDLPDLFYLLERMPNWAGPLHGVFECRGGDLMSLYWTRRLLPHQLGLGAQDRAHAVFHAEVLEALSPDLARMPRGGARSLLDTLPAKLARELARRYLGPRRRADGFDDPFPEAVRHVREAVTAQPDHAAWDVLDRRRVLRLLDCQPSRLHGRERHHVWRLAALFLPEDGREEDAGANVGKAAGSRY